MARQAGPSARSRRLTMVLTQLRVAAGLTRADLAKAIGMSPSKITRIESMESGIYKKISYYWTFTRSPESGEEK